MKRSPETGTPKIKYDGSFIVEEGSTIYEILPGNKLKMFRYKHRGSDVGFKIGDNVLLKISDENFQALNKSSGKITEMRRIPANPTVDSSMNNEDWYELIIDLYD